MSLSPTQAAAFWYRHPFQLLRRAGYYDRGVYQTRACAPTWHKGNFQPAGQRDVDRLPEGSRTDGAVVLFTDVELRTTDAPNAVADRVAYQGVTYEVSGLERWPSHKRYTLTKVGQ